jgi:hypothetical protein
LQNVLKLLAHSYLIAIFIFSSPIVVAQSAGTILFKSGNAIITRADQSTQAIQQHDAVLNGDTIDTKDGRVQIGFIDGGKVSLQPETIYKINQYTFSGQEDGSEYALTELVKGGLRTISGLIGHKNRERYQLATPVATIGIRGTEFTVIFIANKLIMTTNQGSVDVCNSGGCRNAIAGQSVTTSSNTEQPKPTNETAKISAAPPSLNKPIFIQAENLGENGISQAVKDSVTQAGLSNIVGFGNLNNQVDTPIDTSEPTTESQSDILINGTGLSNANFNYLLTGGTLASNANNNLSTYQSEAFDLQLISANLYDFYSDEFVTMGRAKGKVNNQNVDSLNYIAGNATQPANLLQLANLNSALQYNVIASTAPVLSNASGTLSIGAQNTVTGNLSINFATLAYRYGLNIPIGNLTYSLNGADTLTTGSANFSNNATITSNLNNIGCLAGCNGLLSDADGNNASVVGRLIGPNAERAGIQYGFTAGNSNLESVSGSVVMQQQ